MKLVTGRRLLVTVLAGGVIVAGGAATAFAANDGDDDRAEQTAEVTAVRAAKISASGAAGIALRAVPGHVAAVDLDDDQGKAAWDVEVIGKDGKERALSVDAATGKVLSNTPDDEGADSPGSDDD
ncbi:PepSY domain-containing protein [Spirillospora sp. NPDC048911]|uniref:PepSY domain-containing protein n=1 Tax=Spirillospora sp. NPDC048911 TaxID=3364527 RepID=UPI0037193D14